MKGMRAAAWAAFVPLLFALGACSTSKGARAPSGADDGRIGAAATRGGGYYLDDGPGHLSPADVAAIPDAVPRAEPVLLRTSRPYTVFGRTYTPMTALAPWRERGIASWYGRRYHGKPTSSGEPYDMYAMSAAHPTLPIPSYVRVTRVGTGRSVVVRVNDRGPFLQNRVIDLSYTAAAKLGFVGAGSAEVEVEAITDFDAPAVPVLVVTNEQERGQAAAGGVAQRSDDPAPLPAAAALEREAALPSLVVETSFADSATQPVSPPRGYREVGDRSPVTEEPLPSASPSAGAASSPSQAAADAPGFWLQFGAFASADTARAALERLRRDLAWLGAQFDVRHEGALYKVQAGPWPQREHALDAAARVRRATALQPFAILR